MAIIEETVENPEKNKKRGKKPKRSKIKSREGRTALLFIIPAMLSLSLFVFVPMIFSFIMSLYKIGPTEVVQLSNFLVEFFTNLENLNMQGLLGFFVGGEGTVGIFADRGIYLLILAVVFLLYLRFTYRQFSKLNKFSSPVNLLFTLLTGFAAAPLLLLLFTLLVTITPLILPIENYRFVLTSVSLDFLRVLFNTLFWTITCTVFHVVLGIFLAILLNRDFKGKGFFRGIFILPWAIPSFASTVIWKNFIFHPDGFLGSRTESIFGGDFFYFNVGNLFAIIIGFIVVVIAFIILKKSIEKYIHRKSVIRSLIFTGILVIACLLGYLVASGLYSSMDALNSDFFAYNIVEIEDTTYDYFWVGAPLSIFGIDFRMITFSAIIVNIWLGVPFMMVSFLAAMQSIPRDLYEAAEIDGSSQWEKFRKITFPLLKPTLFTVSLLGFVWTFNLFNVVYLLAQNQTLPSPLDYTIFVTFIYDLFDTQHQYAQSAALSFNVFLMLTMFSLVYRKIFDIKKMFQGEEEQKEQKVRNKKKNKKIKIAISRG